MPASTFDWSHFVKKRLQEMGVADLVGQDSEAITLLTGVGSYNRPYKYLRDANGKVVTRNGYAQYAQKGSSGVGRLNAEEMGDLAASWSQKQMVREVLESRTNKFLPDPELFNSDLRARMAKIVSNLAPGKEAFAADAASRGVAGAGEYSKNLYSNVVAPVAREATAATAASMLDYSGQYMQAQGMAAQVRQGALNSMEGVVARTSGEKLAREQMTLQKTLQDTRLSHDARMQKANARLQMLMKHGDWRLQEWATKQTLKVEIWKAKQAKQGALFGAIGNAAGAIAGAAIMKSDRSLKCDIADCESGIDEVRQLRPVEYKWKDDPAGNTEIGLIAQEVHEVIPDLTGVADQEGHMGVRYIGLVPVLINAVKTLDRRIKELEANG